MTTILIITGKGANSHYCDDRVLKNAVTDEYVIDYFGDTIAHLDYQLLDSVNNKFTFRVYFRKTEGDLYSFLGETTNSEVVHLRKVPVDTQATDKEDRLSIRLIIPAKTNEEQIPDHAFTNAREILQNNNFPFTGTCERRYYTNFIAYTCSQNMRDRNAPGRCCTPKYASILDKLVCAAMLDDVDGVSAVINTHCIRNSRILSIIAPYHAPKVIAELSKLPRMRIKSVHTMLIATIHGNIDFIKKLSKPTPVHLLDVALYVIIKSGDRALLKKFTSEVPPPACPFFPDNMVNCSSDKHPCEETNIYYKFSGGIIWPVDVDNMRGYVHWTVPTTVTRGFINLANPKY